RNSGSNRETAANRQRTDNLTPYRGQDPDDRIPVQKQATYLEGTVMSDLAKLDKSSLIRMLQASQEALTADGRSDLKLLHDLQVYQIELELQNRELREAQQALEAGRDRYTDLYDFAPVGYLSLDSKGVIQEANLVVAAMLGVERGSLIGHPLGPWLASGASKRLFDHLRQVLGQDAVGHVELVLERSPNGPRILRLESKRDTERAHCRTVLVDITEQRQSDQRQRLAEQVFDCAQEGIMVTSPDKTIEWVNPAFERITGYQTAEAVGRTPNILNSDRHESDFYQRMWADIDATDAWQGEVWNRRKDGEIYPEWLSISSIRDEAGKIEHYLGMFADITSLHQIQERVHKLAYYDGLTGLPNRWLFSDRLDRVLTQAKRNHGQAALLYIDLDNFKHINDSLGHQAGDDLLKLVAERLQACVRESDTLARLGGDEFALILLSMQSTQESATDVAQKLQNEMLESLRVGENELLTTLSIGIALYPEDGEDGQSLLQHADAAMYRAKQEGRNRYRSYTKTLSADVERRLSLEQELRAAIRDEALILIYQPQVDPVEGRLLGVEALVRWQREGLEPVGPNEFIPVAESAGLIETLDEWVLLNACTQAQIWRNQNLLAGRMAVNLSVHQLARDDLERVIVETLSASGLAPEGLELEITESFLLDDYEQARANLVALHDLGVSLALDDFGTGYSSLAYLKQLPVQRLKIDRSFIRDTPLDEDDVAITSSIITMAGHFRLEVIAEGVETAAQRDFLLSHGCLAMQGYLFAHPLPAAEVAAMMRNQPPIWHLGESRIHQDIS
ncbi:MAG: EAL domain-containing protein, partial [Candidatus Thiodiazotropha sp.]